MTEKILVLEEINLYCGGVVFQIDRNRLPVESGDRLPMTSWISQHKSLHIGPVEKSRTFAQRFGLIITHFGDSLPEKLRKPLKVVKSFLQNQKQNSSLKIQKFFTQERF